VALGARRIHVLPTPITSFTVVAVDDSRAAALRESPLLATLAGRMQTRVATRLERRVATRRERGDPSPPGMPVVETGPGSAETVAWLLGHGAAQILCLPPAAAVPSHVVIHTLDAAANDATFAVAASLLRHVPAESLYLVIHPVETPADERSARLRELLDARSNALGRHGLDLRTEARFGDAKVELSRELLAHDSGMLVLGLGDLDRLDGRWLADLLDGPIQRPVLIVRHAVDGDGGR